ncbi:glucagon-like peptide 1 receptor [Ylistrum balloti]|uniref:glucagon-like peptide 1 receptor n=1 Tax=Ylistrum balloti TaxID=509963 RepID=UPI002905AE8C|nr:glucagon-like peptide 1 receptor [Ylistrum balloti]
MDMTYVPITGIWLRAFTLCLLLFISTVSSWTTCTKPKKVYIVNANADQQREGTTKAAIECFKRMETEIPPSDGVYCNTTFGGGMCWPYAPANSTVNVDCPDYIHGFDLRGKAQRFCTIDGTWAMHPTRNKTLTNYDGCTDYTKEDTKLVPVSAYTRTHAYTIKVLYEIGYAISLSSLVLAVFLMLVFRKLHCDRNTIHVNLFVSFILKAIICLVKDLQFIPQGYSAIEDNEIQFIPIGPTWPCKLVYAIFHYMTTANYMWILVEGLHLHTLIFFALSHMKKLFRLQIVFGWVAPFPFVLWWVIVRIRYADSLCWSTDEHGYLWIIRGPIVVSISINLLFFINIIRVLFTKLTATNRADPNRYRKLARSTLVLIPLFGVYYIVFAAVPDCINDYASVVLMYIEIFCSSFQGLIVAVLFCFMNNEVRSEIAKVWKRHMLRRHSAISFRSNRTISTGSSMFFQRGSPTSTRHNDTIRDMDSSFSPPHTTSTLLPVTMEIKNGDIYSVDANNEITITVNGAPVNTGMSTSEENLSETSRML